MTFQNTHFTITQYRQNSICVTLISQIVVSHVVNHFISQLFHHHTIFVLPELDECHVHLENFMWKFLILSRSPKVYFFTEFGTFPETMFSSLADYECAERETTTLSRLFRKIYRIWPVTRCKKPKSCNIKGYVDEKSTIRLFSRCFL